MTTTTDTNDIGQRRARAGGELGANGEWYEGGKFIATQEDRPKTAPATRWEPTLEQAAERAARDAKAAEYATRFAAWKSERLVRFADVLAVLLSKPYEVTPERWAWLVENGHGGFLADLGHSLQVGGNLSHRQAHYAVKAMMGRETKKNGGAWWALHSALTEELE